MCAAFLTWKDLPAVADMSIDTQLKLTSCCHLICLCTVMLLCTCVAMFPIDRRGQALRCRANKLLLTLSSAVD